jgi:antitoxin ParD1/3/4
MSDFVILRHGGAMMNVSLTPELEAKIHERVESGRYNNASEVVRDALRHLEEYEEAYARQEHLRSLIAVGLEQAQRGELIEFTPDYLEDVTRRAHEAFLRDAEPDPDVCP